MHTMNSIDESAPDPFSQTHWSMVCRAQEGSQEALETLLSDYREPILHHLARHLGIQDAEDACQDYFYGLLQSGYLQKARQDHGKFRAFLLHDLRYFILGRRRRRATLKRGGQNPHISLEGAADAGVQFRDGEDDWNVKHFDGDWATNLMKQAWKRLRDEQERSGNGERFSQLASFLEAGGTEKEYEEVASTLLMTSNAVSTAVSRLRHSYAKHLRVLVSETLAPGESVDEELNYLRSCYVGSMGQDCA